MEMNKDGWIEWKGGKRPVAEDVEVEVRFHGSDWPRSTRLLAGRYDWNHSDTLPDWGGNIVAYRIVEEKAEQQTDPELPDLALKLAEAAMGYCESGGRDDDAFKRLASAIPPVLKATIGEEEMERRCCDSAMRALGNMLAMRGRLHRVTK